MGDFWNWGRWRREAIRDYDRASSRYIRSKRWFDRYVMGPLASLGESAARYSPTTGKGAIYELGSAVIPLAALKVIKSTKLGKLAGHLASRHPFRTMGDIYKDRHIIKSAKDIHKAAGFPEMAQRLGRVQKGRKMVGSSTVAKKAVEMVHSDHHIGKSGKILVKTLPQHRSEIKRGFEDRSFSSLNILAQPRKMLNPLKYKDKQALKISGPSGYIPDRPLKSVLKIGPHLPLDKNHRWVFPPKNVTVYRPVFNPLKNLVPQKINFQPPSTPLRNLGQQNIQSRPLFNPTLNTRRQGINLKSTNPPRGNIISNIARPVPAFKQVPAFRPMPIFRPPPAFRPVPVFRPPAFFGR